MLIKFTVTVFLLVLTGCASTVSKTGTERELPQVIVNDVETPTASPGYYRLVLQGKGLDHIETAAIEASRGKAMLEILQKTSETMVLQAKKSKLPSPRGEQVHLILMNVNGVVETATTVELPAVDSP
jgi:hypothetical protein